MFAGLYTTCRGDRVLVVIRLNVTFLPLRSYWNKCVGLPVSWTIQEVQQCMVARFDAVRLFIPYSSVFFKHYNRILLCDRVPGRYSVSLRACAGHNAFVLHQSLARVGFYFCSCPTLDVVLYQVLQVSEQVSVILWSHHQRHYKTFSVTVIFQSVMNLCCADVCLCSMDFVSGSKLKILKYISVNIFKDR